MAAVQLRTGPDRAANRERAAAEVRAAAADGARLVVLPEAAQAPFGPPGTDLVPGAEPLDGPFVTALAGAAADTGATVVAGLFESGPPGRVHNTTVALGPAGLLGAYRKEHLFDALGWRESDQVAPGPPGQAVVFEVDGLRCGLFTCYDLRFPEATRVLADRGAEVLVLGAHWVAGPAKAETFATLLAARAIENTAWVVAAAQPAPDCAGGSAVLDPTGVAVARAGPTGETRVVAEVTPGAVSAVRRVLPVLANRRYTVVPRPTPGSDRVP